jgi:hypothetical protein
MERLRSEGPFSLGEKIAQIEFGRVVGEDFENLEGEGRFALLVPRTLQILVAVQTLPQLEELTVLGGGEVWG